MGKSERKKQAKLSAKSLPFLDPPSPQPSEKIRDLAGAKCYNDLLLSVNSLLQQHGLFNSLQQLIRIWVFWSKNGSRSESPPKFTINKLFPISVHLRFYEVKCSMN